MRHSSEPARELEHFILYRKRIVLGCRCKEKLILPGLEDDWFLERTSFECGRRFTLANCVEEEIPPSLAELPRGLTVLTASQ